MKTNVNVEFNIIGDYFNPDVVTQILNLEPTDSYIKGDMGRYATKKETCWSIETGYYESFDISEQINLMLKTISEKKETLKRLKTQLDVEYLFMIVINIEDNKGPAMIFESLIIEFANYIGAEIHVDYYINSN